MLALLVVLTLAVAVLALLVGGLLRSHAEILRTLHRMGAGLDDPPAVAPVAVTRKPADAVGKPAADLSGTTPADEAVAIAIAGAGHDTLLAFLSSGCVTCAAFWEAFRAGVPLGLPPGTAVVVVTRGPTEESPGRLRRLAAPDVPVVMSSEAWEHYRVPGAPYFVHVDGPSGRVAGEGEARTWPQLAALLRASVEDAGRHGGGGTDGREARADRELLAAGILPGDLRLHHGGNG